MARKGLGSVVYISVVHSRCLGKPLSRQLEAKGKWSSGPALPSDMEKPIVPTGSSSRRLREDSQGRFGILPFIHHRIPGQLGDSPGIYTRGA